MNEDMLQEIVDSLGFCRCNHVSNNNEKCIDCIDEHGYCACKEYGYKCAKCEAEFRLFLTNSLK